MSNKTRVFEILVEIRDVLDGLLDYNRGEPGIYRLDELLTTMEESVNTTEGTSLHRFSERPING